MIYEWEVTIPELTRDEKRRAYVYLPTSYENEPERHYPVLYMFDGHNLFYDDEATYGKSWGIRDYMDFTDTPLIIAAVECNHDPDNGRLSEYSPYDFRDPRFGAVSGRGDITMKWITEEFKPLIDADFRTLTGRESTFIAGSSMGGLMSLYAVLAYNHIFSRAAALSPSIMFVNKSLKELIRDAKPDTDTLIYMDYGMDEIKSGKSLRKQYAVLTGMLMEMGIAVESRLIPGGTHCEASWERQLPFFIGALMYGFE